MYMSAVNNVPEPNSYPDRIKTGHSRIQCEQEKNVLNTEGLLVVDNSEQDIGQAGNSSDMAGILNLHKLSSASPEKNSVATEEIINRRSSDPRIRKAIMGALLYLDDTQIRNRPGKLNSKYDSSSGDGNRGSIQIDIPGRKSHIYPHIPGMETKNVEGEWANYLFIGKNAFGKEEGRLPFGILDSNPFITSFVNYPLYLFDEKSLSEEKQIAKEMRKMATESMNGYKRGDAYNFWRELDRETISPNPVGFQNIPTKASEIAVSVLTNDSLDKITAPVKKNLDPVFINWFKDVANPEINPYGAESLVNIPNDADDTAVVTANQKLYSGEYDPDSEDKFYINPANFETDMEALQVMNDFRDLDRKKEHTHLDEWKDRNTGAYLTWLKDENLDTYKTPETGSIPMGVNLVDEVVNANAVFTMALNGLKDSEGYKPACNLIADAVKKKHWGGIYYSPQKMIFPYCVSRAYRDGGADEPVMKDTMKTLLKDVLDYQREYQEKNPGKKGAFPPSVDKSTDMSTALGVVFLLNAGRDIAQEAGVEKEYDRSLNEGVEYLLKESVAHKIKNSDTFNRKNTEMEKGREGVKWEASAGGAGDHQCINLWGSEAASTAFALEALTKYVLAYDEGGVNIQDGRRIHIEQYAKDSNSAEQDFRFHVK
jgi:hypothetical protein